MLSLSHNQSNQMKKAAQVLRENASQIMDQWESKVKTEIPASQKSSNLSLRNQLPHLLEDIASIMERYDGKFEIEEHENFGEVIANSLDHGRHRATSLNYTVEQVIREYILFHRVLTDVLFRNDVYHEEVGITLKYTIETAMLNSSVSFADSIQEMREKLVGTLAHDLRTPISAAYFSLDVISKEDEDKRFARLKSMGIESLKKSLELIEGLLDAISVQAGEGITMNFEEIDILEEIKWVYNEAGEIFACPIVFKSDVEKITGVFDGTAIRRIVENLVTNAVKYGYRDQPVSVLVHDDGEFVKVEVHNFGDPINEENQKTIFDFLKHGENSKIKSLPSWGMGLTLVKSVAKAHGGKVKLISNAQDGTVFQIYLKKNHNIPGKVKTEINYMRK